MKEYSNDSISVSFEKDVCIHSGVCIRGLPEVFDLNSRPWINVNGASTESIKNLIDKCPSGALKYKLPGEEEKLAEDTFHIKLMDGGPYLLKGKFNIELESGEIISKEGNVALCRCGKSETKPFCDGTHKK